MSFLYEIAKLDKKIKIAHRININYNKGGKRYRKQRKNNIYKQKYYA